MQPVADAKSYVVTTSNLRLITIYTAVEGMPSGLEADTIYVVSVLAYNALKASCYSQMAQIVTVDETVYDDKGHIVGCLAFCQN